MKTPGPLHRLPSHGVVDGDQQMLEWTGGGGGAECEWAYDRTSHIGKLDRAWDEAVAKGWPS